MFNINPAIQHLSREEDDALICGFISPGVGP